jgi:hypothetical protein
MISTTLTLRVRATARHLAHMPSVLLELRERAAELLELAPDRIAALEAELISPSSPRRRSALFALRVWIYP